MLILSRVCAEFHDRQGLKLFSVTPDTRMTFLEAPESIKEDPLFRMLVSDGSLEVSTGAVRRKMLENDPMAEPEPKKQSAKEETAKHSEPKPDRPAKAARSSGTPAAASEAGQGKPAE